MHTKPHFASIPNLTVPRYFSFEFSWSMKQNFKLKKKRAMEKKWEFLVGLIYEVEIFCQWFSL